MLKEFIIDNKNIQIYCNNFEEELPVVILNTYNDEGQDVFKECVNIQCKNFILVAISNLDWNNDLSPWFAPKLNKDSSDCLGKADDYIIILINKIIPIVEEYIKNTLKVNIKYFSIAGYSLAGLFSVYSGYKTNIFTKIVSASGSFWFPGFVDFVEKNNISPNVKDIYFSLGNKESKVKNKVFATVEENTIKIEEIYRSKGIKTIYEMNVGNHFQNTILRVAKGIKWIIK